MPKYKCIQTVGVAHLLGSFAIPNIDCRIPVGLVLELDAETLEKVGAENFVPVEETQETVVNTPETKTEATTPEIQPEVTEPKTEENPGTETQETVV